MTPLSTNRYRVAHLPAAALDLACGYARNATVLLHGVADVGGAAEVILSTDAGPRHGHHDCIEREPGKIMRLDDQESSHPEAVVHLRAFRFLGRESEVQAIVDFQRHFGIQAVGMTYARTHTNELCSTEFVEGVFTRDQTAKINAMAEHLQVHHWRATVSDSNALGASRHPSLYHPQTVGERHAMHVAPGHGVAADLFWAAHNSDVNVTEIRSVEAEAGVVLIVGLDGRKRARMSLIHEMQHKLTEPRRHRHRRADGEVSHGTVWVEARSAHGGNLRLTEMVARKHIGFRYLQTGRDRTSDTLQGILDAGNRHVWTVCRGLEAWSKENRVEVLTHVLSDDGLGLEHE